MISRNRPISRALLLLVPVAALSLVSLSAAPGATPVTGRSLDATPIRAASAAAAVPPELFSGLRYRAIGPSRGGRVTAVAGHRARPCTFFMGATGGGVWKTEDCGHTWVPKSDGQIDTGSIGAIAVADSDPDIVYVATGSDGLRSNVIVGRGVYKSVDGGDTWEHLGLQDIGNTGSVLIHPEDPELAYVAAIGNPFAPNPERGVFRTEDGGDSWDKVLFISERTGAVDLELAPDDPSTIYATAWEAEREPWTILSGGHEGGVFRSTDGGDGWEKLTDGLPGGLVGKADLAVSAAAPDKVWVLIEAPEDEGGVYRSDDRGDTWTQVTDFQPIRNRPFYYTNLEVHPHDPDVLWGMAEGFWKSTDGGEEWERQPVPHGDNHDMWINPDDPDLFIQSNDGGANVTRDGGRTWSTQLNQPTAELYQVDVDDGFPYRLYAGQQDNSTISVPSRPPRFEPGGHRSYWQAHGGCETGPVVPKPGDPDIVYANCKGRFGLYNRRTGQEQQYYVGWWDLYGRNPADLEYRFQRTVPVHVSPHDPDRVYHGSQYVHVTEDGGRTWRTISPDLTAFTPETQVASGAPITRDITGEEHFATLYEIQESPHEEGVIWVGANDGPVHLTRDGGETWTEVTPEGLGPYGRVQTIEVSPHDPAKAYLSVLRYMLGDFEPYVFKTTDYGQTWTRITRVEAIPGAGAGGDGEGDDAGAGSGTNGIPSDHPVRVVREDPDVEGLLYAGTEFGMFVSFDDGGSWQSLQLNLPATPVTDIKVVEGDLVLSTMGRGFWILYDLTPLHEATDLAAAISARSSEGPSAPAGSGSADAPEAPRAHLFAVRDAHRLHGGGGFSFGEPAPHEPDYPPVGANVDYWLAEEPDGEVRLEILDADGNLVRGFSSEEEGEETVLPEEPGMRGWRLERVGTPALPKEAGMHRFVWDLRHAGPWDSDSGRSGRGGPMVVPGTYTARLTIGDWSATREFEALMDPRVVAEGIPVSDVETQIAFVLEVRDTLSAARHAAARIAEALEDDPDEATAARLEGLRARLVAGPVRYSPRMLIDQLEYLYFNLNRADQHPGEHAIARHAELAAELEEIEAELARALSEGEESD